MNSNENIFDDFTKEILKPLSDGVNRVQTHDAKRTLCGIGFLILGKNYERDDYIAKCYKNSTISIITSRNEVINDCLVSRESWQYLKFPNTIKEKGTMVFWANIPQENKPIIITTINKRNELLDLKDENSFGFSRETDKGSVTIQGLGETGTLNVFVDGEDEETGQIIVRLLNSASKGLLSLYIQGNGNFEFDGTVNLKLKKSIALQFIDESNAGSQTNISYVLGEGFNYNDEFGNKIVINERISISNAKTSIFTIFKKILMMYIGTQTIDGKPLSPNTINKATQLLTEVSQLFK